MTRSVRSARRRPLTAPLLCVLALAALLCLPSRALARVVAPPGNAGVEQYVEVVPGAEGNVPVGSHRHAGGALTGAQRRRLQGAGAEGAALAAFAEATGASRPRVASKRHGAPRGGSAAAAPRAARPSSTRPRRSVTARQVASVGGGLGAGLPIALGAIALAAVAALLLRRRAR